MHKVIDIKNQILAWVGSHTGQKKLCGKIQQLYPEIRKCGIDLTVDFDKRQNAWVVDLKKYNQELKHFHEIQLRSPVSLVSSELSWDWKLPSW